MCVAQPLINDTIISWVGAIPYSTCVTTFDMIQIMELGPNKENKHRSDRLHLDSKEQQYKEKGYH